MPTCSQGGVRSSPTQTLLKSFFDLSTTRSNIFLCGCSVDLLLKPVHLQVEEERGRERTRLPPARGGGKKEEMSAAGVEVEKVEKEEKVEKVETSEQPSKPPAAPRRKKK